MALTDVTIFDPIETWFIDKDDGTVIHFFSGGGAFDSLSGTRCPPPAFLFEQNINTGDCDGFDRGPDTSIVCPGTGTFIGPRFDIKQDEVVPPLPDDFTFQSGSISRFDDRLSLFLEEFTPSRVGESTALISLAIFDPAKTYITRYDFINVESLGTSNGSANQEFTVSGSEIKTPTRGTPIVFVGGLSGTRFSVTDDLTTAGLTAVFEYDETTGKVTFGNGTNGLIPANGEEIILKITIRNGGGVWEFVEVVEPPKSGINIGGVKSIRDKNFYVQTNIALADAGKMVEVVSVIDVVSRSSFLPAVPNPSGLLTRIEHQHDFAYGGSMTASGGEIILFGTSATAFTLQTGPSTTQVTFEVDTSTVYPNISASVPGVDGQAVAIPGGSVTPNISFAASFIRSGIITTPKNYISNLQISPLASILEIQTFREGVGNTVDPSYFIDFTIAQLPSLGAGARGISTDRVVRLIEIGDPDTSAHPNSPNYERLFGPPGNAGDPIVTVGTFDDPVTTGVFNANPPVNTIVFGSPSQIIIGNGKYRQRVVGDSSRRLDFVKIKYECRQSAVAAAEANHIRGASLPDFVCTFTFTTGAATVLPDI